MKTLEKHQIVFIAAVLLAAAGFGLLRIVPQLRQRQSLDETLAQNRRLLNEIETRKAQLPALTEQFQTMQEQARAFEAAVPTGRGFADLWQQIADLMNQCNLGNQLVQPGRPIETDRLGAIPLTLSADGTMQDLYAFFRAIERWPRLIRFEQIELTNDPGFEGRVKLTAKAMLYYQGDNKQG